MDKGVRITRLSNVPTDTELAKKGPERIPSDLKEDTARYLEV